MVLSERIQTGPELAASEPQRKRYQPNREARRAAQAGAEAPSSRQATTFTVIYVCSSEICEESRPMQARSRNAASGSFHTSARLIIAAVPALVLRLAVRFGTCSGWRSSPAWMSSRSLV